MNEVKQVGGSKVCRFSHSAMATSFESLVADEAAEYARQASEEMFRLIDGIEEQISRYRESSDIWALNHAVPGRSLRVGQHTFACLQRAQEVYTATGGAFDVTIGPLVDCWRNRADGTDSPAPKTIAEVRKRVGMDGLILDSKAMEVRMERWGLNVDLGGIGKGYALDQAADLLREWGIECALLNAGESTVLALGTPQEMPGWPVGIGGSAAADHSGEPFALKDSALSGSGTDVKGHHVLDPRTGYPAEGALAAWAICESAAQADALSTAFMVMKPGEVEQYCRRHAATKALLLVTDSEQTKAIRFGL